MAASVHVAKPFGFILNGAIPGVTSAASSSRRPAKTIKRRTSVNSLFAAAGVSRICSMGA